ncbi:MAG TPA: rhomboid family intramembrane serine protease, partial [Actinopolymorphaceae bacterium]
LGHPRVMAFSPATPPGTSRARRHWVGGLQLLAVMVGLMWVLEIIDIALAGRLDLYGIRPWSTDGLSGILFAPFLHVGFGHLIANTVPLLVLGAMIALGGALRLLLVTVTVGFVSGIGTWLTSPPSSVTIGASGLVFGYATYLIMRGIFNRSLAQLAVGAAVALFWGGALLGGLVPQAGISWQGHLFGAVGGVVIAWLLAGARNAGTPGSSGPSGSSWSSI